MKAAFLHRILKDFGFFFKRDQNFFLYLFRSQSLLDFLLNSWFLKPRKLIHIGLLFGFILRLLILLLFNLCLQRLVQDIVVFFDLCQYFVQLVLLCVYLKLLKSQDINKDLRIEGLQRFNKGCIFFLSFAAVFGFAAKKEVIIKKLQTFGCASCPFCSKGRQFLLQFGRHVEAKVMLYYLR